MDPEKKKSLNFIFPTKYGTPKSLKLVSHWLSKNQKKTRNERRVTVSHLIPWQAVWGLTRTLG